jgi:hypothetical protein
MKGRETEKEERKCNSQNGKMLLEYDVLVLKRASQKREEMIDS